VADEHVEPLSSTPSRFPPCPDRVDERVGPARPPKDTVHSEAGLRNLECRESLDLRDQHGHGMVSPCQADCHVRRNVDQVYVDAAEQFAKVKGSPAGSSLPGVKSCRSARRPSMPFSRSTSSSTFQDPAKTLLECRRVLKPGGRMFLVFPGYFQPLEHHLSLATRAPFIHYVFGGDTLVRAYHEILEARGDAAAWYKRSSPSLEPWERGNTINGLTLRTFRRLVEQSDLRVVLQSHQPLGGVGRRAVTDKRVRVVSRLLRPLAQLPLLEEAFLHRIAVVLGKP
jgi:hypothetical protein